MPPIATKTPRRKPSREPPGNPLSAQQQEMTWALAPNHQVHLELGQISRIFQAGDASFSGGPHGGQEVPETADVRFEEARGVHDRRVSVVITVVDDDLFAWNIKSQTFRL